MQNCSYNNNSNNNNNNNNNNFNYNLLGFEPAIVENWKSVSG